MTTHYIYTITNKINGKVYVGKTKNLEDRWKNHCSNVGKKRRPLYDGMLHYGVDNFVMEVIDTATEDRIDDLEKFWIEKLDTLNNGYNLTEGGTGGDTFSNRNTKSKNITRKKLSDISKRRCESDEYIQKLRDSTTSLWENENWASRVRQNSLKVCLTESYKQNMSRKMKEVLISLELRKKWSDVKRGKLNNKWLGYMYVIEPNGKVVRYETAKEAASVMKTTAHVIRQFAKNNTTFQRGKYIGWRFILSKDETLK
jgi:group I intron endonuclease